MYSVHENLGVRTHFRINSIEIFYENNSMGKINLHISITGLNNINFAHIVIDNSCILLNTMRKWTR